jgi:hypothetical protein
MRWGTQRGVREYPDGLGYPEVSTRVPGCAGVPSGVAPQVGYVPTLINPMVRLPRATGCSGYSVYRPQRTLCAYADHPNRAPLHCRSRARREHPAVSHPRNVPRPAARPAWPVRRPKLTSQPTALQPTVLQPNSVTTKQRCNQTASQPTALQPNSVATINVWSIAFGTSANKPHPGAGALRGASRAARHRPGHARPQRHNNRRHCGPLSAAGGSLPRCNASGFGCRPLGFRLLMAFAAVDVVVVVESELLLLLLCAGWVRVRGCEYRGCA